MIKLSRPCNGRKFAEAAGFEPASRFYTANCFRGSLLQPLGHASCLFPLRILKPPDPLFKGAISATCTPSAQCQRFVVLRAASDDAWGKWRTRRLSVFAIFIVCRCKYPASPRRLMTPGECGANLLNVSGINNKKIDYPKFILIIRNSYRVLSLFTVRTVISTKRSAWRDLSTTLEMTIC